ncbi:Yae1 domain-containing protein 1 [Elysia marginata]|uniref:Yae1 domain-containing protein 1 n=1 Tax=Elysia marginata TaxID=1093978 RepID=A0AAV4HEC3_9GAST|nr:Yae1 domain-containing protein 1 [Elysia marginata]
MSESPKTINDPFASDDEEFSLMHKEWSKVDSGLKNAGIRDGFESSQDQILQDGFNAAFREALRMAIPAGKLQGSISAVLSYQPPLAVRNENSTSEPKCLPATRLNELLAENATLLAQIPQILQHPLLNAGQLAQTNRASASASSSTCSELDGGGKERQGDTSKKDRESRGCEKVCSNRAHFWSQLESFKGQAGPLGVLTDND